MGRIERLARRRPAFRVDFLPELFEVLLRCAGPAGPRAREHAVLAKGRLTDESVRRGGDNG